MSAAEKSESLPIPVCYPSPRPTARLLTVSAPAASRVEVVAYPSHEQVDQDNDLKQKSKKGERMSESNRWVTGTVNEERQENGQEATADPNRIDHLGQYHAPRAELGDIRGIGDAPPFPPVSRLFISRLRPQSVRESWRRPTIGRLPYDAKNWSWAGSVAGRNGSPSCRGFGVRSSKYFR